MWFGYFYLTHIADCKAFIDTIKWTLWFVDWAAIGLLGFRVLYYLLPIAHTRNIRLPCFNKFFDCGCIFRAINQ